MVFLSTTNNFSSYLWQNGSANPVIPVAGAGTYYVDVTDAYGCKGSDTVEISVTQCSVSSPNIFTPNGDGINDIFMIPGDYADIHCEIYDRWGLKMYEWDGAVNCWDGTYMKNGRRCSDGTYYYIGAVVDHHGKMWDIHGFLTLHR
jgi:gliding motility-associated-like protein